MDGAGDDLGGDVVCDLPGRTRAWLISQPTQTPENKPAPPLADGLRGDPETLRHGRVG